jgi:hypothetical protein
MHAPDLESYLTAYREAKDPASRRFEAAWLMLHAPGMTPWVRWGLGRWARPTEREMFRDNGWPVEEKDQHSWFLGDEPPTGDPAEAWIHPAGWDSALARTIFTAAELGQAQHEHAALTKAGPGANFVCAQTLAWAKTHRDDPRLPEALHLCVQATRYGYTDDATTGWSRQAFKLLHQRFPNSSWAAKTKYWY